MGAADHQAEEDCSGLAAQYQVSKAANRIVSHGMTNHSDPNVREQLRAKLPPRKRSIPYSTVKVSTIVSFNDLLSMLLALSVAVAPDSRGLRNEFLVALGERMDNQEMKLLERLGMA